MFKGSLKRQHYINFHTSQLLFGHLVKECVQVGFREMSEREKLGI